MEGAGELSRSKRKHDDIDEQKLPDDLVVEILEWLPVSSLLRFKCISKRWYDLITTPTPTFINNHLLKQRRNRILLVRRCLLPPEGDNNDDVFSFYDLDSPSLDQIRPSLSLSTLKDLIPDAYNLREYDGELREFDDCDLLGSCNGIVCVVYNEFLILCNPALPQFRPLPPCPLLPAGEGYVRGKGFGVTSSTNEFKVILIKKIVIINGQGIMDSILAHVFTSSTNSWKQTDATPPSVPDHSRSVFLNGVCHWFTISSKPPCRKQILSFDINTEVFKHLELPSSISDTRHATTRNHLTVHNECLAIVDHACMGEAVGIWVMEEYGVKDSWNFKYNIRPRLRMDPFLSYSWNNGNDWLLVKTPTQEQEQEQDESDDGPHDQLTSICLKNCDIKRLQICGVWGSIIEPILHQDSLVSLN